MTCLNDQLGMEFTSEEIAECKKRDGLLSVELELSHSCNLRCLYCYAESGEPLENELSMGEICNSIDQACELGVKKIIVLGGGEPLLYPRIFDVLDYIREKKLVIDLFTNGLCLNDDIASRLYERGIGIVLKMNSMVPEIQDYLAGKKGAFKSIQQGLKALEKAGYPSDDCHLGIETVICRQNYEELPDLWRWARKRNIIPYVEVMTMQGRATEHLDLEVGSGEVKSMFETLSNIDREEFGYDWQPHPPLAASQCARHEYSCTIAANGEVYPCPGVTVSGGNIRVDRLSKIISETKVFTDLRNIRETIKGECAVCKLHEFCYGCRGHAYQITGDYLAEDPLCWLKNSSGVK